MNLTQSITKANNIIIVTHIKPDGDCLGSGFAMRAVCRKLNKNVDIVSDSPVPDHFAFLKDFDALNNQQYGNYDLCIVVDCGDEMRMGKYAGYIKKIESINIDHHITNTRFGKTNHVVADSSSTCEIVYDLLSAENLMDCEIASYLYVGLSTDTGHFMHSNVTPKVLKTAYELANYGVDTYSIASNIYRSTTMNKQKLVARAIGSMRFFHDDEICIISIMQDDLKQTGCVLADTEGLIDYAINIKTVKVAISITETNRPQFKCSYRSKGLDVSKSASVFGGGGHVRASGCVVGGHYEDVICKLVKSVTDFME